MKPEEQSARKFLTEPFGKDPRYEPRGAGTPPDFCIDRAAFEVRRLNQRYFRKDGSNEGLEQTDYRLNLAVRNELAKIPLSNGRGSFFWILSFRRPLKNYGRIAARLGRAARDHYFEGSRKRRVIEADGVALDLIPASNPQRNAFLSGGVVDDDSGGFVRDLYFSSIRLALEEKIAKTKGIAEQFDRWVLILVDFILPGLMDPSDIGPVDFKLEHFSSVVVINPDGTLALEWPAGSLLAT